MEEDIFDEDGFLSHERSLKWGKVKIRNRSRCKETFAEQSKRVELNFPSDNITRKQICAGNIDGIDACSGDSGGPLVCLVKNKVTVVGIVSFGKGCSDSSKIPGVYTHVAEYFDWITNLMVNNLSAFLKSNTVYNHFIGQSKSNH